MLKPYCRTDLGERNDALQGSIEIYSHMDSRSVPGFLQLDW